MVVEKGRLWVTNLPAVATIPSLSRDRIACQGSRTLQALLCLATGYDVTPTAEQLPGPFLFIWPIYIHHARLSFQ